MVDSKRPGFRLGVIGLAVHAVVIILFATVADYDDEVGQGLGVGCASAPESRECTFGGVRIQGSSRLPLSLALPGSLCVHIKWWGLSLGSPESGSSCM